MWNVALRHQNTAATALGEAVACYHQLNKKLALIAERLVYFSAIMPTIVEGISSIIAMIRSAVALASSRAFFVRLCVSNTSPAGVDFNVIAREWRMKWSADNDKQSLALAQAALSSVIAAVNAMSRRGFKCHALVLACPG